MKRQNGLAPARRCERMDGGWLVGGGVRVAARGGYRFQWAGRPQGMPLEGGRAETSGTSETSGMWQEARLRAMPLAGAKHMLPRHAMGGAKPASLFLVRSATPGTSQWSRRSRRSRPRRLSRAAASRLSSCWPAPLPAGGPGPGTRHAQRLRAFPAAGPRLCPSGYRETTMKAPPMGVAGFAVMEAGRHAVIPSCSLSLLPDARARSATSCRLSPTYMFFSRHKV